MFNVQRTETRNFDQDGKNHHQSPSKGKHGRDDPTAGVCVRGCEVLDGGVSPLPIAVQPIKRCNPNSDPVGHGASGFATMHVRHVLLGDLFPNRGHLNESKALEHLVAREGRREFDHGWADGCGGTATVRCNRYTCGGHVVTESLVRRAVMFRALACDTRWQDAHSVYSCLTQVRPCGVRTQDHTNVNERKEELRARAICTWWGV
jgi:hypothetical protein